MKKIGLVLLLAMALLVATASAPNGWKWGGQARADDGSAAPSGWSWNEAEVVATGNTITLAGDTSTVTLAAPQTADATVGDSVVTLTTANNTLIGFRNSLGETSWVPLGWSWND